MVRVIGWDIGGANVKATHLAFENGRAVGGRAVRRYFEIWRNKAGLGALLRQIYEELGAADSMAVTMTAELADVFSDKAEGVAFILRAMREAIPETPLYAIDLDGRLVPFDGEAEDFLAFAATNWIAEALVLADRQPDCLMVDIGSTTTDLIPIVGGKLVAKGRRDIERLASGELIYTGALRTPVAAIVSQVPLRGTICRVSAEYFAIAADVNLVLGRIGPGEYVCATPDGRGKTAHEALGRLARVVCEDSKGLTPEEIIRVAAYIAEKQVQQITEGMYQVLSRFDRGFRLPVVAVGIGAFLGASCAQRLGLEVHDPPALADGESPPFSPCAAAAYLLGKALG
ncbi:MAG TPA: hydantoinase/oxoprolinase family protein [Candidatus Methylomirabilis sp.]|nr:hydantoinase/oxoprolinase family protein [Candidatus Methylomirabilis sp.]